MKKYMLLHYGFEQPTKEMMEAWNSWFESISDIMIDMGGFTGGREITVDGAKDLPWDMTSLTGYNIIKADSLDGAEKIARRNPFISSIRVYELRSE